MNWHKIKSNFRTVLVTSLFVPVLHACQAQEETHYVPVLEVPELTEGEPIGYDIAFQPTKIKNLANDTEAEILFQNEELSFGFFNDVLFTNPQQGLIVGGTRLAIRTTLDGGKNWRAYDFSRFANAFHSTAQTKDHVYVLGESRYVFRSNKQFENWEVFDCKVLYPDAESITWYKLRFLNDNFGIAVGERKDKLEPLMMLTKNAGKSWESVSLNDSLLKNKSWIDITILDTLNWLVLDAAIGSPFYTADAGKTWSDYTSPLQTNVDATLRSLWMVNPKELYGVGSRSFWRSTDFGKNWMRLDISKPFNPIEDYNEGDYLVFTDISGIDDDIYLTSTADYIDDGRYAFAYKFDRASELLKPILLSDTAAFIGDSHAIYALDKENIFIMDRDKLYRVKDKN